MDLAPTRPPAPPRRLPVGAEIAGEGVHFRVWAPAARQVTVRLEADGAEHPLTPEAQGHHAGWIAGLGAGARYCYRLDGGEPLPDPASRFQPEGPLGPSMVVDPGRFAWTDAGWRGVGRRGQVLYELHVGTFTPEGTWRAAIERLPHLAETGITLVEMMPANEFGGAFGWGYDGVGLFAPTRLYGQPDDLRAFVDAAHGLGIGVLMDVVYNHVGAIGNVLKAYSPDYFTDRYATDWGEALNFDQDNCEPVRAFVAANAAYWIDEFHMDGLRLDATQNIYDFDPHHEPILALIARRAREAARGRGVLIMGENEPQDTGLLADPEAGGCGLDALWNDDFHHSALVALTGRNEAYYQDYRGSPQELVSAVRHGFLYQGQRYRWQGVPRGTSSLDLAPERLVAFLQNHDQIANSGRGSRLHQMTGPGEYRAMTALLLLGPATPMLFQGQEFGASAPFHYVAGVERSLGDRIDAGRKKELAQFPSLALPEVQAAMRRPDDPLTFAACKLDWDEVGRHGAMLALHRDLLRLRREDATLARQERPDGAVIGPAAFALRFRGEGGQDRLLLVNLGLDLELAIMPEPLLAPPAGHDWTLLWSSEDPAYGGTGAQPPRADVPWVIAGRAALLLAPGPAWTGRKSAEAMALEKAAAMRGEGGGG